MATNFYKVGTSYYRSDNDAKILNTDELKSFAAAGGKEITAPTQKAGSVAIANPSEIGKYNVTNNIGGTLYGTLKNVTSDDISTGMKVGSITPPANPADLVHQTFANNASQYTDGQKNMFSIYEQQQKEAQAAIDKAQAAEAENQKNIEQNKTDIKNTYTENIDNPDVMGWRQKAIGITSADLQAKYNTIKTNYDTRKTMVDEVTQLSQMFANELAKPQAVGITSVINARMNNTKEQYASRISALQAGISALDGNISLAQTFIDNGINTVNADRTDRLNYLNFVQGLYDQKSSDNKEALLTATEEQKKAIENEISVIKGQIEQTEKNKEFITDLLTGENAQTAVKAGVTITDTPDQAAQKIAKYTANNSTGDDFTSTESKKLEQAGLLNSDRQVQLDYLYGKKTTAKKSSSSGSYSGTSQAKLTPTENKKLEQAGLLEADRQTQLDYLYGDKNTATANAKVNAAQKEMVSQLDTVDNMITTLLAYNNDGTIEGIGSFGMGTVKSWLAQVGFSSEEGMSVRALIGNIKGTLAKMRGGTSFTANEEKLLNSYVPTINDNQKVLLNKLAMLQDFIRTQRNNIYQPNNNQTNSTSTDDLRKKYNY
jgi:hypothetical protein